MRIEECVRNLGTAVRSVQVRPTLKVRGHAIEHFIKQGMSVIHGRMD
jgi:hypothetical protein